MREWTYKSSFLLVPLVVLLVSSSVQAQYKLRQSLIQSDADTSLLHVQGTDVEGIVVEERSTGLAMLMSAVLPGAGQVYTERYLSIPIIWGFGTYFGVEYARMNKLRQDYASQYDASVRADTLNGIGIVRLKEIRDFYRDERDSFAIYLALTYLLNIVDAYVGAALYGFDVSPDLTGGAKIKYSVPMQ